MRTIDDRENFEKQVEDLISESIKGYPAYFKKYNSENQKQLEVDFHSLKTYVSELVPPIKEIYPEKDFPFFQYFIYNMNIDDLVLFLFFYDFYYFINYLFN